jgi:very-short-patch-repair endonuclease
MRLRSRQLQGVKFRRQQPIGPYIVDFASFERKLIIEIDGGQHNEERINERDEERTTRLKEKDYRIIRFWNNEVLTNLEGILEWIRGSSKMKFHPHLNPLPSRERIFQHRQVSAARS